MLFSFMMRFPESIIFVQYSISEKLENLGFESKMFLINLAASSKDMEVFSNKVVADKISFVMV